MTVRAFQPHRSKLHLRPRNSLLARIVLISLAAPTACAPTRAEEQTDNLGNYVGTIHVSGTLIDPRGSYRATAKVILPISQSDDDSISAEFLSGEAPNASVIVSDWDVSYTEKSAGADGKYSSWSCALAGTADIPMSVTGTLEVDRKANTYAFSIALLSAEDLAFNCTNSSSGEYRKKEGIALYVGTGSPGMQSESPLPLKDATHLADTYTLNSKEAASANYGPIIQEWDLRLAQ
ncbi:MAG: hypothetical protein R3E64_09010 [Halioglobus sp.]